MSQTYKIIRVFMQNNQSEDKGILFETIHHDDKGNAILKETYDENGNVMEKTQCHFDERGRITGEKIVNHAHGQGQSREITYHDDQKSVVEIIVYQEGGTTKNVTTYNDYGLPVRIENYYEGDDLESVEKVEYNDSKQMVKHSSFDEKGNLVDEEIYSYESDKISISKKMEEREYKEIHTIENGRPVLSQIFEGDTVVSEIGKEYDERGKLVKESIVQQGILIGERTYDYDDKGNTILEESQDLMHKRIRRVMREYYGDSMLSRETYFSTMGMDENYMLTYEYE
jgi:antitoxin component YwqK of YwqJK toxin-antitoxin module